jgi:general secretion pathway protein J
VKSGERGFTLLELIIALSIVGALLAVAFGGMRVALGAWRQGEERAEAHQHARGITVSLARAIGAAYPYTAPRGEAPDPDLLFAGEKDRIELVTQSAPFSYPIPIAFTAVVIELGDGEQSGMLIRQRPLPNKAPFDEATVVLRDPTVTSLAFEYLDEDGRWGDTWGGDEQTGLPHAIKITVGTTVGGRTEQLAPITVSLKVTGGQ